MSIKIITNIDLNKSSFLEKLTYKLSNNLKNFDERYKELNKYPDLRKNFQTILSKITKS